MASMCLKPMQMHTIIFVSKSCVIGHLAVRKLIHAGTHTLLSKNAEGPDL